MRKILATGVTGNIGRHLSREVEPLKLDLTSLKEIDSLMIRGDYSVIHLAGIVGEDKVRKNEKFAYSVNVEGTACLAEKFLKSSSGKFVFASTAHVYAKSVTKIAEDGEVDPSNVYAAQKYEAECRLREIFHGNSEQLLVARIFSVLDWNMNEGTLGSVIHQLINSTEDAKIKNSDDIRDFLTPRTVAGALEQISSLESTPPTINLCSGKGLSVGEAARRMLASRNYELHSEQLLLGNSTNPVIIGDSSNLKKLIGNPLNWTFA